MGQGRLGETRSSDAPVVQASPRLPTWSNRLSVQLTQAPSGFWARRRAAGMKTQQGGPSWSPCWGGESGKRAVSGLYNEECYKGEAQGEPWCEPQWLIQAGGASWRKWRLVSHEERGQGFQAEAAAGLRLSTEDGGWYIPLCVSGGERVRELGLGQAPEGLGVTLEPELPS